MYSPTQTIRVAVREIRKSNNSARNPQRTSHKVTEPLISLIISPVCRTECSEMPQMRAMTIPLSE